MSATRSRNGALATLVGAGLLAAGPVMLWRAAGGRREIRGELAAQKIAFPTRGLPAHLTRHAGAAVRTGPQAHAYAELIKDHVAKATGGRTYAEVTEELHATGGDDEKLTQLRQTAFMGETLRASLLSAYQAWEITTLVAGLGAAFTGVGAVTLATARALRGPRA
ncbi:hypothetical protein [Streptomyces sp. NPDC006997]|uniref:hypothetical protein n=1 Tax=Streptomyces sp. NPDC006997 TaxID=3155356 RepID=UPI00340372CA